MCLSHVRKESVGNNYIANMNYQDSVNESDFYNKGCLVNTIILHPIKNTFHQVNAANHLYVCIHSFVLLTCALSSRTQNSQLSIAASQTNSGSLIAI